MPFWDTKASPSFSLGQTGPVSAEIIGGDDPNTSFTESVLTTVILTSQGSMLSQRPGRSPTMLFEADVAEVPVILT